MSLEINNLSDFKINQKTINQIYRRFLSLFHWPPTTTVSLALVDLASIKKLNQQYRGRKQATDILSFSSCESEKFPQETDLGEVIICYPVAVKQAKKLGHSVEREIAILFAHGLVHLMGHEHGTKKEAGEMGKLEEKVVG